MEGHTAEAVRLVKQGLRSMMNGVAAHSMRQKGLTYKVNFGVELPRLQAYAEEIRTREAGANFYSLALQLWSEPIRECRLLASMLMPPEEMDEQTAEMWVEQTIVQEEAEHSVMHLFCRLPFASTLAFRWIAHEDEMHRFYGWLLMGRLFMQGLEPCQRDADELLDQLASELQHTPAPDAHLPLAATAYKAVLKYMELSPTAQVRGEEFLQKMNL